MDLARKQIKYYLFHPLLVYSILCTYIPNLNCKAVMIDFWLTHVWNCAVVRKDEVLGLTLGFWKIDIINLGVCLPVNDFPPIYLYLIFEICISQNWFLNLIFELDFLSILNLIFAGYTGSKNQVWNRQKIKFKNQFREMQISKIKYR